MVEYAHNLRRIGDAIRQIIGVEAKHQKTVRVSKSLSGEIYWEQDIEVFDLLNHPKAKVCYAWAEIFNGSEKTSVVLGTPSITSAEAALDIPPSRVQRMESGIEIKENVVVESGIFGRHWASLDDEPVRLAKCFRVCWRPLTSSKEAQRYERYEGYFFCMADIGNPEKLLSEKLAQNQEELIHFELDEVNEVRSMLGLKWRTCSTFGRDGYRLRLGNIVFKAPDKPAA